MAGNDVTSPQASGSDPEVTFLAEVPRSGCKRPKTHILCVSLPTRLYLALGGSDVTGNDVTWPQVTGSDLGSDVFDRKSPGSGCRRTKAGVYCAFDFLQGCYSQEEAVTWQKTTSRDLRWPEVTQKWRHLTGTHLEVAVESRKLAYNMHLTSYKAVARRTRLSRDRKWRHVT